MGIEDIMERLKRLTQDIWRKIEAENSEFFVEMDFMNMVNQMRDLHLHMTQLLPRGQRGLCTFYFLNFSDPSCPYN